MLSRLTIASLYSLRSRGGSYIGHHGSEMIARNLEFLV